MDKDEVVARFEAKELEAEGAKRVVYLREAFQACAGNVSDLCPEGRAKALALTALEESAMWAVKSVSHG